jgi:hypothetical protein
MFDFGGLNWLAILAAGFASFALGGIWYGPLLGTAWMKAIGKTADQLQPSPMPYVISAVTALLTAIVMAALIATLGIAGPAEGALLGLIVGVGFIATSMASDYAFCGWSLNLFAIQSGYRVIYSIVMGVILAWWQ